jgi:hypothetical protein
MTSTSKDIPVRHCRHLHVDVIDTSYIVREDYTMHGNKTFTQLTAERYVAGHAPGIISIHSPQYPFKISYNDKHVEQAVNTKHKIFSVVDRQEHFSYINRGASILSDITWSLQVNHNSQQTNYHYDG